MTDYKIPAKRTAWDEDSHGRIQGPLGAFSIYFFNDIEHKHTSFSQIHGLGRSSYRASSECDALQTIVARTGGPGFRGPGVGPGSVLVDQNARPAVEGYF